MTGRTRPMDDAIVWESWPTTRHVTHVEYQPGNGTRYNCIFVRLDLGARGLQSLGFGADEPAGVFLFAWLTRNTAHSCHVFRDDGYLAARYVAEKLGCGLDDAAVLAELIAHYTQRTAQNALKQTAPRPCPNCGGSGKIHNTTGPIDHCLACDGEGVQRLST